MNARRRTPPVTTALLALLALLLIAAALFALPRAYVGYHQWQADRAINDFAANGQTGVQAERIEYHLDRLVAAGKFRKFQYEFKFVDSASPQAQTIIQAMVTGKAPPRETFESPAGQKGKKLRISVVCRREDVDEWEAFVKKYDAP